MRGSQEKTEYLVNACIIVSAKKCYITFELETISQLKHKLLTILLFPNVVLQVKHRY